jgi:hypothetical protein
LHSFPVPTMGHWRNGPEETDKRDLGVPAGRIDRPWPGPQVLLTAGTLFRLHALHLAVSRPRSAGLCSGRFGSRVVVAGSYTIPSAPAFPYQLLDPLGRHPLCCQVPPPQARSRMPIAEVEAGLCWLATFGSDRPPRATSGTLRSPPTPFSHLRPSPRFWHLIHGRHDAVNSIEFVWPSRLEGMVGLNGPRVYARGTQGVQNGPAHRIVQVQIHRYAPLRWTSHLNQALLALPRRHRRARTGCCHGRLPLCTHQRAHR